MINMKTFCWIRKIWALMNRIQSKYHRIGTHEINKISLSCFVDKTYIQNNGYDGLAVGYQS